MPFLKGRTPDDWRNAVFFEHDFRHVRGQIVERALGRSDVFVVSNPEYLREGSAVHDFLNPDRVVIGAEDQSAAIRVAGLYLGLAAPLQVTDPASAETIKYASNAFLATKISFINAIAAVTQASELERYFGRARGARMAGALAPWQLKRIDERLADPERPPPDVAELAGLCGVSPRHLMRCFKQTRGMTVLDYVERGTFARAARLLRESDLPLKTIAARLGYAQACSFAAAFRRHFGETPRAYRNQSRGGQIVN